MDLGLNCACVECLPTCFPREKQAGFSSWSGRLKQLSVSITCLITSAALLSTNSNFSPSKNLDILSGFLPQKMKKATGGLSNSLFSYFKPVQKTDGKSPAATASKKPPNTPFGSKSSNKTKTSPPSRKRKAGSQGDSVLVDDSTPLSNGLLVWAKMDGRPWWPSMVTPHPTSHKFLRGKKSPEAHILKFFSQPPTRSWVPVK